MPFLYMLFLTVTVKLLNSTENFLFHKFFFSFFTLLSSPYVYPFFFSLLVLTIPYHTILSYPVLYNTIPYHTIPYLTMPCLALHFRLQPTLLLQWCPLRQCALPFQSHLLFTPRFLLPQITGIFE
ncbi:dubious [Schizosaccharomyces pombe]|uniref:Putative uncharacterized protein C2H10.04 n=1 Tax=Schizosaccharomyces pombe (strain 972 / ATCC 24843) TaxID=284812 RepID=YLV4_SCHPO|nr:uncharacterized protein SPAC2H10.04 [Schizosaccharomyces pombe]G2TRK3.1 RecName: Full=Putative uncharacterized protein C2H10.04 [Schizosaccharomyces pombe 972h-]CCD31344.1 dubious [Schizosaccharomyces pombe]|eukprot:NP_001343134.1 uncharacterized protein SPAC2H10.04 [Schizosaccharomyces pombe]